MAKEREGRPNTQDGEEGRAKSRSLTAGAFQMVSLSFYMAPEGLTGVSVPALDPTAVTQNAPSALLTPNDEARPQMRNDVGQADAFLC